jgi:hypothetical protein
MTIHADSTFVYDGDSGDLFYTFGSTGKWRRQGNKLVLDSDRQADVVEVRDTDSDRIVVEVPGGSADDTSVMIVGVPGVSGTRYVRLNENGQAVFPKQEFSQFLITRTSGVSIMNFTIEDNRHDYYKVVLPPWDSYTDFENETWRIRGGDLFERVGRSTNRYDRK